MEDFFLRALAGGIGVALASGPIGCFVVWRRMAYFGTALAHTVLLGVALGFLLEIEPTLAVLAMCFLFAGCLALLERQQLVSLDTLLGVLAHMAFAAGLVALAFMERMRVDLIGYLFGDILSVGPCRPVADIRDRRRHDRGDRLAVAQSPCGYRQQGPRRGRSACRWNGCACCSCSCSPR